MDTMFRIPIWDPATPAFVSFRMYVYGFMPDIAAFCKSRKKYLPDVVSVDELCSALDAVISGKQDVNVSVAYQEEKIVVVDEVVATKSVSFSSLAYRHMNVWGYPYNVMFSDVSFDMVWLKDEDRLLRVSKLSAGQCDLEGRPVSFLMGEPGVLVLDGEGIHSTVYLLDVLFENEEDMKRDIETPSFDEGMSHILEQFVAQIVADG